MTDLHISGIAEIDGRFLRYQSLPHQDRLRITFCGNPPWQPQGEEDNTIALGSVTGLDTSAPTLRISAPLHAEWARAKREHITTEAVRIWTAAGIIRSSPTSTIRYCEG
ncbi:hypothetical protein [Glycomyces buryatensis]|uniref:Uncharacterized protein n=1 Tax=Glycomyces buryatensis TaxID=2570927 RepID=A0A4V4HQH9_9ACTN|nr:hypothetical protein [Glycomyces buryatensis]THV33936.1 hypothetical protein FAB82_24485 [Glycomyces buryatensis]